MNQPTTPKAVLVERDGPVTRVTLNRPERHNALEAADVEALEAALVEAERDDAVRVVVLTGAGGTTFSSGAWLPQMESGEMSGALFDTLTGRLAALDLPTVARIDGSVYGGGAELALSCDFRVGVRGSRLRVPAARLGVCYPPGGIRRYVTRLGPGAARRILLSAEELDADEMLRVGFLTHLVDAPELDEAVSALTTRLASLAPLAIRNMKQMIAGILDGTLSGEAAEALVGECADSEDLREGLRAWRDGRAPDFRGR